MPVTFEWDDRKSKTNLKKHRISFDEAKTVFRDALAKIFHDPDHSIDEDRELIVGHSARKRLLIVSFIERPVDVIRIISARIASKNERKAYEEDQNR